MDDDVLTPREIEFEERWRRVQNGTLETVERNAELLQVRICIPGKPREKIYTDLIEISGFE